MKKRWLIIALAVLALDFGRPPMCSADTAAVLPKGVFGFTSTHYHYFDFDKWFNDEGKVESLAADYNRNLTGDVFPNLAALDPLVGGKASLGRSIVDFKRSYDWFEFELDYGITDNLSVGMLIPYNVTSQKVKTALDTSKANVGKNPYINSLAPLYVPGTVPLTKQDVLSLLGKGLDINRDGIIDIPGYGFNPFRTWDGGGVGDIEIGAKYRFWNSKNWRFAAAAGLVLPSGKGDDPDELLDVPAGDDQTDLFLRLYGDYTAIKNLLLNITLRYYLQLPDHKELRIPDSVDLPLTVNRETVSRDLGDIFECRALGTYNFTPEISAGFEYRFTRKYADSVNGKGNLVYSSLEDETDSTSHMALVSLGYSTVQKYLDKKFPVPLSFDVTYRNRFAGTNVTKSQYVSFALSFYFKGPGK